MKTPIVNWTGGERRGRAGNAWIIGFALAFLLVIIVFHLLAKQEAVSRQNMLNDSRLEPKDMVERFFLEVTKDQPFKATGWEELTQFISSEDMDWLERNRSTLASLAPPQYRLGDDEREERYAALQALLRFGKSFDRPVITRAHTKGDIGVVFIHDKGNANSMRAVFIIQENGLWKFRRFLGRRDDYDIMKPLLQAHEAAQAGLSEDEESFKADPQGYWGKKRNGYLVELGLPPVPTPTPTPTPFAEKQEAKNDKN